MAGEIDLTLACAVALVTEAKMMTMKARAVAKKRAGFFERGEGVVARGACNIEVFLSESVQVAFSLLDGDQAFSRHKPADAFRVPRNCGRGKSKAGKYGNSVSRADVPEKGRRANQDGGSSASYRGRA